MKALEATKAVSIFQESVLDWHKKEAPHPNPYPEGSLESTLYQKNHIDTIQWHIEDEIRRPDIALEDVVALKRKIDKLNQDRTDMVEKLDDFVIEMFRAITPKPNARLNSESPAWLLDRMSILELKIYHMEEQVARKDASASQEHIAKCQTKLDVLLDQREDLKKCLDELFLDYSEGTKRVKVYRQMKMYNDQNLNPSLYKNQK
ncbi:DUF4254 domain-containing protein [Leptospira terpstrae]|uniref:PF14063 family protein n=1 Tax=Leptospira terpstrae serovar Hualin str. LT 11-33 = ATCC 700639 TaxID=1257025 RepID=N1W019_9LEPT|nr:DUF4254 domain-containing protein [Leptospira terpstrae]EMY62332.1 PF14063 family protein [Leptospira terpstrae serovar Hualin str. LT 11-33 = ATCC 700639]